MSYRLRVFGDGMLPSTKGTLVLIATGHSGLVSIDLTNTGSSLVKVNIYRNVNGTSRRIGPKDLQLAEGDWWPPQSFEVEEGDTIEGEATVSNVVSYVIGGIDRS